MDEGSLISSTGLKDKYGKDIYLGDKVRWTKIQYIDCSRTEVEGTEITEGIVDWMGTTLVLKKDGHAFFLWRTAIDEPNELEIIGNIYDLGQIYDLLCNVGNDITILCDAVSEFNESEIERFKVMGKYKIFIHKNENQSYCAPSKKNNGLCYRENLGASITGVFSLLYRNYTLNTFNRCIRYSWIS